MSAALCLGQLAGEEACVAALFEQGALPSLLGHLEAPPSKLRNALAGAPGCQTLPDPKTQSPNPNPNPTQIQTAPLTLTGVLSAGCTHPAWRRGLGLRGGLRQLCSYLQPPQRYADLGLPQPDQGLQVELTNLPPHHLATSLHITSPPHHFTTSTTSTTSSTSTT